METGGGDLVEGADHFLQAYRAAQVVRPIPGPELTGGWSAPLDPKVRINFDVGFLEPHRYPIAVVARNAEGICMGCRARRLAGQTSSAVGEARATLEGVLMAVENGWTEIELEGDNSEVISAIQNRIQDALLPYGATISLLISSLISFNAFSCRFVRKSGNSLAHSLAHLHFDSSDMMEALVLPANLANII